LAARLNGQLDAAQGHDRTRKKKGIILPARMPGGPNNPLGARALYIRSSLYRMHGTNNPSSIGGAVSSGCIRLTNTDIIDLYKRAKRRREGDRAPLGWHHPTEHAGEPWGVPKNPERMRGLKRSGVLLFWYRHGTCSCIGPLDDGQRLPVI
jgi:hypothetical protein